MVLLTKKDLCIVDIDFHVCRSTMYTTKNRTQRQENDFVNGERGNTLFISPELGNRLAMSFVPRDNGLKAPTMPNALVKAVLNDYANKYNAFTDPRDRPFYCFNASA